MANSSVIFSSKAKDRDDARPLTSKRLSQTDERPPMTSSKRSSRQHSRAPSLSKASVD
jgi:hypothetical protein